jgi:hypothetical protein
LGSTDAQHLAVTFYTAHQDGCVMEWASDASECVAVVPSASEPCRTTFLDERSDRVVVMRIFQSKSVQIWTKRDDENRLMSLITENAIHSRVTAEASCHVEGRLIFALAFKNGTMSIHDGEDGAQLLVLTASSSPVKKLRVFNIAGSKCPSCGNYDHSGLSVAAGLSSAVLQLYRVSRSSFAACDCRPFSPAGDSSATKSASLSPLAHRRTAGGAGRRPSEDVQGLSYPLSPHGLRRFSHAANDRKKAEELAGRSAVSNGVSSNSAVPDHPDTIFTHTRNGVSTHSDASSPEEVPSWSSHHLGDIQLDERGCWDTDGSVLIGIRRKSNFSGSSPLARWEVWTTTYDRVSSALDSTLVNPRSLLETLEDSRTGHPAGIDRDSGSDDAPGPDLRRQLPFYDVRHLQLARTIQNSSTATAILGNTLVTIDTILPALSMKRTRSRQPLS